MIERGAPLKGPSPQRTRGVQAPQRQVVKSKSQLAKKIEPSRITDEALIGALKEAAGALNVKVLPARSYDAYRKTYAPELPSSRLIRKWLGSFSNAVKFAGLEASEANKAARLQKPFSLRFVNRSTYGTPY